MTDEPHSNLFFVVNTPLGFAVRVTRSHWNLIITVKHPIMANRERQVQEALRDPDEVRLSRSDVSVYLFYVEESHKRWVCAVCKRLNHEGFLITTYPTDAIKEGERLWPK